MSEHGHDVSGETNKGADQAALLSGPSRPRRPKVKRYLLLAGLVFGAIAVMGILDRRRSESELAQWTEARAIPSVNLATPKHATEDRHLTLPADIEAFYTAPIHSRVSGYVRMWYFDIGAHVKAGDVLASIDTPDLDQQYQQAKGELAKAQADYDLAVVTADRWRALRGSQAVSQQAADEKTGDAQARKAVVFAAQANLDRVKAMENFKEIVAPFDGIVTARRIDIGALVSPSSANEKALFDVASVTNMRVYARVPQIDAASMHKGVKVTLALPQYPGQRFAGTVDTTSDAISDAARALLVEAIFPNPDGLLKPGAYAEARFELPLDPHKLVVPASAMIFRDTSAEVATVRDGSVTLKKITILVDLGNEIEVAAGLRQDDRIVVNPTDSIETGDEVKVVRIDGKAVDEMGSRPPHVPGQAEAGGGNPTHEARQ